MAFLLDPSGNLYIADDSHTVLEWDLNQYLTAPYPASAQFEGSVFDALGDFFVADDSKNHVVWRMNALGETSSGVVESIPRGDNSPTNVATIDGPSGLMASAVNSDLYVG